MRRTVPCLQSVIASLLGGISVLALVLDFAVVRGEERVVVVGGAPEGRRPAKVSARNFPASPVVSLLRQQRREWKFTLLEQQRTHFSFA